MDAACFFTWLSRVDLPFGHRANLTSLDGDPDRLTSVFGLDDLLFQAVNPDAAVEDFADFAVLAYEDAALGVLGGVARMNADAML